MKNLFGKRRFLFDVDSGSGSGAPVTPPATPETTPTPEVPPVTPPTPPADDKAKTERYLNMTERQRREKAEARIAELEKKKNEVAPIFDEKNDPDGKKENDYQMEKKANEIAEAKIKKHLEDLGLEDTLSQIKQERELDQFHSLVEKSAETFKEFGIQITREEAQNAMKDLDTKGITPEQLIALAKLPDILKALKNPGGFVPGDGWKANVENRTKTQAEINAEIYKAHGVFGFK